MDGGPIDSSSPGEPGQHEAAVANGPRAVIRTGVGGWTFEPWRDNFYPKGLPHSRELAYASERLTMVEVNGTYYGSQKPATFARWRDETPDHFVFSLKASRFATLRRDLGEAGESIRRFIGSGIAELGPKLGPLVWQFPTSRRFEAAAFDAFLAQLPSTVDGLPLRHVLDVRHDSFLSPDYLALARRHQVATVFTDSDDYPSFADLTGAFVYARIMRTDASLPRGISDEAADAVAACARVWRDGGEPQGLPRIEARIEARVEAQTEAQVNARVEAPGEAPGEAPLAATRATPLSAGAPRDVYLLFISGDKVKAPHAAVAVRERLDAQERAGAGD